MRTFVMGDIHGAYKAFIQCLERAGFNQQTDLLIQLGDIVDGYPEVYETIEHLISIPHKILIKGNHDDWLESFLATSIHPSNWRYGGQGTVISYLQHAGKSDKVISTRNGFTSHLLPSDIPKSHKNLLAGQRLYHKDLKGRVFVHGGFDRHLPLALQQSSIFFWDRDLLNTALEKRHYYPVGTAPEGFYAEYGISAVFAGHSPTTHLPEAFATDRPVQALNITDLDTGAGHRGKLTIMELPDAPSDPDISSYPCWQSDPVTTLYAQSYR